MEEVKEKGLRRCLELKLISCRDLKAFNLFHKISVYAVVSIFNQQNNCSLSQQKTPVDAGGGGNPEWNLLMQFDLNPCADHMFLKFKLRCGGVVFGKRSIGEVRVPLKDLIEECNGSVRFLSYQVRNKDGKPNGVLNFSYVLKGNSKKPDKIMKESDSAVGTSSNHKCSTASLYPSLDDLIPPLPLASAPAFYYQIPAAQGVYHPCPSPLTQQQKPLSETLAYGYGGSYPAVSWAR